MSRAAAAGFPARGLKSDLSDPQTLRALAASAREPRIYLLLGNTLGALEPLEFLRCLSELLRPLDQLVADAEIFDAQRTMAGYDNPINRRFAFAPLASIGLADGRDGELVFESGADAGRADVHWVSKHFRAARKLEITVAGRCVALAAGEKVEMSRSLKYSRAAFLRILGEAGRLTPRREFITDDGRFLMVVAAPVRK
jgi:uncharacterized SAM-dependent methyltransferase